MIKLLLLALTLEGGAALWLAHRAIQRAAAEEAWVSGAGAFADRMRLERMRVPARPYQQAS